MYTFLEAVSGEICFFLASSLSLAKFYQLMTQPIAKTFSAVLAPVKLLLTVIFWSASLASLPKSATNMEYKELDLVESWQTFKCI